MSVTFDAKMTSGNQTTLQTSSGTACSSTGMTIGASGSLLVVVLVCGNGTSTTIGAPSGTWDGVALTAGPTLAYTDGGIDRGRVSILYLVNPAVGNKTLSCSWTGSSDCYMSCISFSGTDTTTGINAADNVTTATTTVTVPSTTDGATVAVWGADGGTPTMNFTTIFGYSALSPGGGATYTIGGTSNGHTFTGGGTGGIAGVGVHVIAAAAAAAVFKQLANVSQAVKRAAYY